MNHAHSLSGSPSNFVPQESFPLSHGQRALWFLQRLTPESVAHNVVHAARIRTEVDVPAFRRAFQRLVNRHPALRTTFAVHHGEPVQQVHKYMEVCFQVEDASTWSSARLDDRLTEEMFRPFDLEQGPLLRVTVFTQSPCNHLALLCMHHIVTDMWSLALTMYEVAQFYRAEVTGEPPKLKSPRAQYSDYIRWQAEMLAGPEEERLWDYWRERLAGELPVLSLPTDRPRPLVQTDRGAAETLRFSPQLTERLKTLSRAHEAPLYVIALAAFQVLLHRYTGQEDIIVGFPKASRTRKMARVMGYFINPVAMRANLSGNPTFSAFLDQVRQTVEVASEHDAYPFPLLVEQLQPTRELSRPPIFQVMFSWQKTTRLVDSRRMGSFALGERERGMELGGLPLEAVALPHRVTPFDMTLLMAEAGDELAATVEYNTDLFDAVTIRRMLRHFKTLLAGIAADPERAISYLPLLTDSERHQLLVEWNDTTAKYPQDVCVHHLFEAQAAQTPEAVAVIFEEETLTYRELNRRANQLAHHLQKLGVGPDTLVGICVERSLDMVVGLLGILKAGGAYLPLDPTYPQDRLAFMLEDAQTSVLLTQERLIQRIGKSANQRVTQQAIRDTICLDTDWGFISQEPDYNPDSGAISTNLAYVIYTSGSTGRPKGVLLEHRGLCNLVTAQTQAFGVEAHSRVLQFASFSFDASVSETFMALLTGATLYLARQETLMSVSDLQRLLRDQAITTVTLPPSVLSVLSAEGLPALQTVISAGEACSPEVVARWASGRRFFNAYGPTEATVGPTLYEVEGSLDGATNVPIGRPIANTQVYLLDRHLQPVPIGVPGELHIGGVGLARGYLNRPGLTAQKFILDPFASPASGGAGARLYKTGDLARYRSDGVLEFLGRKDHQVKVRGFRIELGEIEAALKRHAAVREAVLLVREDTPGDKRVVGYVVFTQGQEPTISELRYFLKERLPEYMVPSAFVTLEALPLTPSGKVDRKGLPVPKGDRSQLETAYVMPQTEVQRAIAAVWREVLGVEKVGIHDNFFELGGHSLLAIKVHNQLQEVFQREMSMVEMFRYPTVSALAEYLGREPGDQPSVQRSLDRASKQKEAIKRQRQLMSSISRERVEPGLFRTSGVTKSSEVTAQAS
ncbi:MAG: amino acid adenylation domain-containing protein [Chloroflexota bacterium]|nr:amino acid adenylation domain-containing protein [Chloroflexota bacterium]